MRINSKVEYVWSDKQDRYIPLKRLFGKWTGPVARCKGASAQQTQLADSQQAFYNTLTQDYSTQFANQNAVLAALRNTLDPIIKAGPNQFGFSTGETNTLNSQALQGTGVQYNNAKKALAAGQAARGGGNAVLPSGVDSQQQAELASAGANQASNELLDIQRAGYETGRQQYNRAIAAESDVAGMYNPAGFADQATSAGSAADQEANKVAELNNAASPWNLVGGILGGAMGAGLDAFTGGIGGSLATSVTCPARGSLFLLPDGTQKKVEELNVGDFIMGIDGEPQEIEEIQIGPLPVLKVKTENGFTTRNSTIHAFALPFGGFVIAAKSLGKNVVTANGPSKVVSVEKDGVDTIYNVITDGSHTYRADGVWALGQGEGEREVSTETWKKIGNRVTVSEEQYACQ